jgi:5'(3')-deoxyribonucleotidase
MSGGGLRFNDGKTRYDLIPPFAQEQYAKVLTVGSIKYAPRNWERGMEWSKIIASMKRHTEAFWSGEDYDKDTGILHTAHIMCNAAFLTEYYKIYPQGDDRPHWYTKTPRIALDVDEVIADFISAYCKKFDIKNIPEMWNFDMNLRNRFKDLVNDKEFWMDIKPKIDPSTIPFEPHCYITSRTIPKEWTEEWISKNGFPTKPVFNATKKLKVIQDNAIDIFVDDRYENFAELSKAGVCCFLMDAPHNKRYNVGYKRIFTLRDIPLFKL